MLNELIGAVLQILVFAFIPFLTYLVLRRSARGFFEYIGLKKSVSKANLLGVLACLVFAAPLLLLTLLSAEFSEIMLDPKSITGKFREMGLGINSVTILVIVALFKTSLSEEILFRGFIAKRLIDLLGFQIGNLAHSVLFGLLHLAIFLLITKNPLFLTIIFVVPSIGAFVSVYLNEKIADGSIIPGWISHALANLTAYSVVGFII